MNHQQLHQLIDEKFDAVTAHIKAQATEEFVKAHTPDKWSNGQHFDHLRKTTRALNKGMAIPKLALRLRFGKKKGKEDSLETITNLYNQKVGNATAPDSVKPDVLTIDDKSRVLDWFQQEKETLKKNISNYSEKQLSSYALPHPVLGLLSIREMVYWCVMHTEHHHKLMKRDNLS